MTAYNFRGDFEDHPDEQFRRGYFFMNKNHHIRLEQFSFFNSGLSFGDSFYKDSILREMKISKYLSRDFDKMNILIEFMKLSHDIKASILEQIKNSLGIKNLKFNEETYDFIEDRIYLSIENLGGGIVQCLWLLTTLEKIKDEKLQLSSIVCIDNPEVGIHPHSRVVLGQYVGMFLAKHMGVLPKIIFNSDCPYFMKGVSSGFGRPHYYKTLSNVYFHNKNISVEIINSGI